MRAKMVTTRDVKRARRICRSRASEVKAVRRRDRRLARQALHQGQEPEPQRFTGWDVC